MVITINKPYIENAEDKVYLCSNIVMDNITKKVFYEVDLKYKEYLFKEGCDSFFIALLPYALTQGYNICINSPITERLYLGIRYGLIPCIINRIDIYKNINITNICNEWSDVQTGNGIGMGMSGGVDSLYSYFDIMKNEKQIPKITHLTYFNVGSHRDEFYLEGNGAHKAKGLYEERMKQAETFSRNEGIEFVAVNSNIGEVFNMEHVYSHSYRSASAVLAVQKLFRIYYYSSGVSNKDKNPFKRDPAYWEDYLFPYLSFAQTQFFSWGGEKKRIEKVMKISTNPLSNSYINVCLHNVSNCSVCEKCRRTMLEIWALDIEELFKDAFDWEYFHKEIDEYLLYGLYKAIVEKNNDYCDVIDLLEKKGGLSKVKLHFALRQVKSFFYNKLKLGKG